MFASSNHRRKMKAEPLRPIPRNLAANLELLHCCDNIDVFERDVCCPTVTKQNDTIEPELLERITAFMSSIILSSLGGLSREDPLQCFKTFYKNTILLKFLFKLASSSSLRAKKPA